LFLTIAVFILVFLAVTLAHELGHLIFSKLVGIRVHEFGLGFGPTLLSFDYHQTIYKLNLFPILGYVKIAGVDPEEGKDAPPLLADDFINKPLWARFVSIVSGPVANLVFGFILYSLVFASVGIPAGISNEIATISPGSPAASVGLLPGDRLIKLNSRPFSDPLSAIDYIHHHPGTPLSLTIQRGDRQKTYLVTPKLQPRLKIGLIGFSLRPNYQKVSLAKALWSGLIETWRLSVLTLVIVGKLLVGQVTIGDLAGPVGIAQITGQYAQSGLVATLGFIAFFSINVAILNLVPLPALDGGRLFFMLLELVRRKPINIELENKIHAVGLTLLLVLMAVLTINDLLRLFR
jgi:regulator of sigma E protease